jgi:trk system potassium uptake protein TrkH
VDLLAVTDGVMFVGGGSASTAGGIKLTTFLIFGFVIWAEIRGEPDVTVSTAGSARRCSGRR